MKIGMGHHIRNFSGEFACPNCWPKCLEGIVPGAIECPNCGVLLEWDIDVALARQFYDECQQRRKRS